MAHPLQLISPRFQEGEPIPIAFTCEGEDKAPPLHWGEVPPGTRSLALLVDDPDAPDPQRPQRTWCHWILYNLPPGTRGLPEGATPGTLPAGTREGLNDWHRAGYGGPCPPIGRHRYVHHLYALDTVLPDLGSPTRAQLLKAIQGHVLAEAQLIGTYEKTHPHVSA
ncbi:YbhB/YbcL family Raf kinase inhibitor-like protein [Hyalangium sp.]|uniref:YbhB/YbcL family Raf kinase inhibitor-like protein n=1 Tax=Hyalangium sp. TaxID=2028555 RepID=UPI002D534000|nr:YbhB/YbcL family Raf kinase inhibitor-like protein [Hyalangium sp.]HYH98612.1 YbhB/YbcL family Raf kinase inhibitor-like protein [Hyalangium sp.]